MQVARAHFWDKSAALSTTVVKNTSCSRGWLRFTVQSIFAVLTTASFILILRMTLKSPTVRPNPAKTERCVHANCRIMCSEAPYYGNYEEDIINAVTDVNLICPRVILELSNPSFINNSLPNNWLSRMQSTIDVLAITKGNLKHLPSGAFMSQFAGSVHTLYLQGLNIETWDANSLVGLTSLEMLKVVNCDINHIQANSLRAVDDTLRSLIIVESGYWNPSYVTGYKGFDALDIVNFSHNHFANILGRESFVGLDKCKILYLNSCGIYSIGVGAFDFLLKIEVIFLHANRLITLPPGLFDNIVLLANPRPRISLQDNSWHCDCAMEDLRQLVRKEVLLVESTCVNPKSMRDKTFTELENLCANKTDDVITNNNPRLTPMKYSFDTSKEVYINGTCVNKTYTRNDNHMGLHNNNVTFRVVAAQKNNLCALNKARSVDVSALIEHSVNINTSTWLKFFFFVESATSSALHLGSTEKQNFGLLWFQSECPYELYCLNSMPTFLRIYNVDLYSQYTFCPLQLSTGNIESNACYAVDGLKKSKFESNTKIVVFSWLVWMSTVIFSIIFGAVIIYSLIRIRPTLLKGSKRILFVKHKSVDALVLPPKVPLRNDLINDSALDFKDKEIFTLCSNDRLKLPKLNRMKSTRSNKSSSASYISALQPSEDQLAEWRISHHFNNDLTVSSQSELTSSSWICDDNTFYPTYESLE